MTITAIAAPAPTPDDKKDPRYIAVTMGPVWMAAVTKAAKDANVAPSRWIKQLIGAELGLTLDTPSRSKYANKEERIKAQAEKRVNDALFTKGLVIEHYKKQVAEGNTGAAVKLAHEQKLLDALRAKLLAKEVAKATAAAALEPDNGADDGDETTA